MRYRGPCLDRCGFCLFKNLRRIHRRFYYTDSCYLASLAEEERIETIKGAILNMIEYYSKSIVSDYPSF